MTEEIIQETTNAVLSTKIDGLAKLTDERFLNIKESLNRIELHSTNYALKSELEDTKKDFNKIIQSIKDDFTQHNKDDRESFGSIGKKVDFLSRTVWLGMGGLAVIVFVFQVVLPYLVKGV